MTSPYRSASPPERALRPVEPEDEMRLILESSRWPRKGVAAWSFYLMTIIGAASLVLAALHPIAVMGTFIFLVPAMERCEGWLRRRRRISRLREQGYDVGELEQKLRVVAEPHLRVHDPSDEQGVDADVTERERASHRAE